jgi:hypothetical protein
LGFAWHFIVTSTPSTGLLFDALRQARKRRITLSRRAFVSGIQRR